MQTSYFANIKKLKGNFVSIARKTPDNFPGLIYEPLAPPWWLLEEYKYGNKNKKWYIEQYVDNVLAYLNPHSIVEIIGEDAILCCYESPEKFCHRHIVAKWFERSGYKVREL
jgi:hypothetical protein